MPNPVKVQLRITAPPNDLADLVEREIKRTEADFSPAPLTDFRMSETELLENASSRVTIDMTFLPQQVH